MRVERKHFTTSGRVAVLFLLALASGCSTLHQWESDLFGLDDPPAGICLGKPLGETPVSYNNENLIVLTKMNGYSVWFIVDSGSERTTVTPWVVTHFGLPQAPGRPIVTNGVSGSVAAQSATIAELEVGPLKAEALETAVAPLPRFPSDSGGIVGVLGADFLAKYGIEYDLPERKLRFYAGDGCETSFDAAGYDPVPIKRTKAGIAILSVEVNGVAIPAALDSGATVSGLNVPAAVRAGVTSNGVSRDPTESARGFGGSNIKVYFHTFQKLTIGSHDWHDVPIAIGVFNLPFAGSSAQMLLGLDFLNSHLVILPRGGDRLYIKITERGNRG